MTENEQLLHARIVKLIEIVRNLINEINFLVYEIKDIINNPKWEIDAKKDAEKWGKERADKIVKTNQNRINRLNRKAT